MARLEQTKHLSSEEHSHCVSDTLIVKMTARFTCVVLDCQHYGPSIAITPLNTELPTPFSGLVGELECQRGISKSWLHLFGFLQACVVRGKFVNIDVLVQVWHSGVVVL